MNVSVVVAEPIHQRLAAHAGRCCSCSDDSGCVVESSPQNNERPPSHHTRIIYSQNQTPTHQSSYRSYRSYHTLILLTIILQYITITHAQPYSETDIVPNPQNKYCGMTYAEAHQFCHLPPNKSLPCPNDAEKDCPYNMPCWEILEPCTAPPVVSPTEEVPMTERSANPGDHNFCGLGFDNLFGW